MSRLTSGHRGALSELAHGEWGSHHLPWRRERPSELSRGLVIAGVVAVGVGLVAWHYLGADLRRYMKIQSM